jgi:hypothetical protein
LALRVFCKGELSSGVCESAGEEEEEEEEGHENGACGTASFRRVVVSFARFFVPRPANSLRDFVTRSVVAGGAGNLASGIAAAVGGGGDNKATGAFSTVAGGRLNTATGEGALALGM